MVKDDMIIKLSSDETVKIIYENDISSKVRILTFDEFVECMNQAKELNEKYEEVNDYTVSELLPNTNDVKTLYTKTCKKTGDVVYVMFKKKSNINITYHDSKFKNVGYPNLIFAVKVSNGEMSDAWVVATKDDVVTDETNVYKFPLSNVYHNGRICFGSNRIRTIELKSHKDVARLPGMFLSMPFNDHNYASANSSGMPPRKLLEALENKPFNEEWLKKVEQSTNTLREWVKRL